MNPRKMAIFILTFTCAAAWWLTEVRLDAARDLHAKLASEAATHSAAAEFEPRGSTSKPAAAGGILQINPAEFLPSPGPSTAVEER